MKKSDVVVGMQVTCKTPVEAYYSNYGGSPTVFFNPGMIGTVGAINVPSVKRNNVSFVCVDFKSVPSNENHPENNTWRVALNYDNIVKIKLDK